MTVLISARADYFSQEDWFRVDLPLVFHIVESRLIKRTSDSGGEQ